MIDLIFQKKKKRKENNNIEIKKEEIKKDISSESESE